MVRTKNTYESIDVRIKHAYDNNVSTREKKFDGSGNSKGIAQ